MMGILNHTGVDAGVARRGGSSSFVDSVAYINHESDDRLGPPRSGLDAAELPDARSPMLGATGLGTHRRGFGTTIVEDLWMWPVEHRHERSRSPRGRWARDAARSCASRV